MKVHELIKALHAMEPGSDVFLEACGVWFDPASVEGHPGDSSITIHMEPVGEGSSIELIPADEGEQE